MHVYERVSGSLGSTGSKMIADALRSPLKPTVKRAIHFSLGGYLCLSLSLFKPIEPTDQITLFVHTTLSHRHRVLLVLKTVSCGLDVFTGPFCV